MRSGAIPRRILLMCGLLSSIGYAAIDVAGALSYPVYDYAAQAISELSAIGALTERLLGPLYVAFALLFTAFGVGVRASADGRKGLRVTAGLLIAVGLLGVFAWPFFPMHLRGAERSLTDSIHLVLGVIDVLLLALAIVLSSGAFGKGFRLYSWATMLVMLVAGGLSGLYVPSVGSGLPTPYLGVVERISIAAWLLWIAVLSIRLLREARARRA